MRHWPIRSLGDLTEVLSGFAFDSACFHESGKIRLVRIRDVVTGRSSTFFRGDFDPKFIVRDGDILIGMDGEFNRARWQGGEALLNQRVCRISAASRELDDAYLFHFLPAALKAIEYVTPFVTVKHLSVNSIRDISIPLPPLPEQRRIAEVLDRAEALRAKRCAALAQLDSFTQSIFLDMFGDPVANIKDWPIKPLEELCLGITDIDHKMPTAVESGVPFISAKDLTDDGRISFEHAKQISEEDFQRLSRKSKPEKGDIIYSRIGVNLGKARIVEVGFDFVASYSCCTIKPNRKLVDEDYLCRLLDSPFILRQAHKGVRAIAVPDLGLGEIKAFRIILPPLDRQREFARRVEVVDKVKTTQRSALAQLDALFASLQHRAFRGEL